MKKASILLAAAALLSATQASAEWEGDAAAGATEWRACMACHTLDEGVHRVGPSLYGLWGRDAGTTDFARYSDAMKASGISWSPESLFDYLVDPRGAVEGTTMAYAGMPDETSRQNLIAYVIEQIGAPAE